MKRQMENGQGDGQADEWNYGWMDIMIDRFIDEYVDGWWREGYLIRQMDGEMDDK